MRCRKGVRQLKESDAWASCPPVQRGWSRIEGFTDGGVVAKKERVAELLEGDDSDVEAALASIRMER